MSDQDHPILRYVRKHAPNVPEGRDQLYEATNVELAFYPASTRVELIQNIEGAIAADEGNLRERAQLLALHRHMSDTHERLLRAKR